MDAVILSYPAHAVAACIKTSGWPYYTFTLLCRLMTSGLAKYSVMPCNQVVTVFTIALQANSMKFELQFEPLRSNGVALTSTTLSTLSALTAESVAKSGVCSRRIFRVALDPRRRVSQRHPQLSTGDLWIWTCPLQVAPLTDFSSADDSCRRVLHQERTC